MHAYTWLRKRTPLWHFSRNILSFHCAQNSLSGIVLPHHPGPASSRLSRLHWLPVRRWIRHKISLLTYKSQSSNQPPYLRNLLQMCQPSRCLRSASRKFRIFYGLFLPALLKPRPHWLLATIVAGNCDNMSQFFGDNLSPFSAIFGDYYNSCHAVWTSLVQSPREWRRLAYVYTVSGKKRGHCILSITLTHLDTVS